jgi:hypothetical protein
MAGHCGEILFALACQNYLARTSSKKLDAKIGLKTLNLPANCSGCDKKLLRSASDTLQAAGSLKGAQRI